MEHATNCFARLVRIFLGNDAIAEKKLDFGPELVILGIEIKMGRRGFRYRPSSDKVARWSRTLDACLEPGARLMPGQASKLAGQLAWGGAQLFNKLGRAMLRPIFDQKTRRDGRISADLRRALQWWKDVLSLDLAEVRLWSAPNRQIAHLFCDAAGAKPALGAVLFVDGQCLWTSMETPESVIRKFRVRKDKQIMGLELLAISVALSTFNDWLKNRSVVIYCDNTGAEV